MAKVRQLLAISCAVFVGCYFLHAALLPHAATVPPTLTAPQCFLSALRIFFCKVYSLPQVGQRSHLLPFSTAALEQPSLPSHCSANGTGSIQDMLGTGLPHKCPMLCTLTPKDKASSPYPPPRHQVHCVNRLHCID